MRSRWHCWPAGADTAHKKRTWRRGGWHCKTRRVAHRTARKKATQGRPNIGDVRPVQAEPAKRRAHAALLRYLPRHGKWALHLSRPACTQVAHLAALLLWCCRALIGRGAPAAIAAPRVGRHARKKAHLRGPHGPVPGRMGAVLLLQCCCCCWWWLYLPDHIRRLPGRVPPSQVGFVFLALLPSGHC